MGSSCSSGQKDKDGKKKKKGKGAEQTPRGSNASNSSVYVYQKAEAPPPEAPAPLQSTPVPSEHPPLEKTDSKPLTPITSPHVIKDALPSYAQFPEHVRPLFLGNPQTSPPHLKPKKIVLFVCADFTDSSKERAVISEQVFPKIRRRCAERGYEITTVDWDSKNDVRDLVNAELERHRQHCHLVPVVLFNESLGQRSLPPNLSVDLKKRLATLLANPADEELINERYFLDENNNPPQWTRLDSKDDDEKLLDLLKAGWEEETTADQLTTLLESTIQKITSFGAEHNKRHCVWICRKFLQRPATETIGGTRFTALQSTLQNQIDDSRKLQYSIRWSKGEVDPSITEHAQYLNNLVKQLETVLVGISDAIMDEVESSSPDAGYLGMERRLYYELIQQMNECRTQNKYFVGQDSVLKKVEEYLKNDSTAPFILHGPAGSGKTVLAARIVKKCSEWFDGTPIVFRFVGITPDSATTEQVVRSICEQCCLLFGEHPSLASQNMLHLAKELPLLFNKVSPSRRLILVIDAIDQVQFYSSLSLAWIPANLAAHVKLILTLRNDTPQLSELKALVTDSSNWLSMSTLTATDCQSIIRQILQENNRKITATQNQAINKSLEGCSVPLFAAVVAHEAVWWPSTLENPPLQHDTETQILHLFKDLENSFGDKVVSRILGYLSAAKHGLMDSEMVDLLCCDETLDQNHRTLSIIWAQINLRLDRFLKTSFVGKLSVTHWGSWTFRAVSEQKYLGDEGLVSVSRFMVDYFQSKWAEGKQKKSKCNVLEQPIKFGGVYNRRKLDELPLHAHRASATTAPTANSDFLFNADWLQAKVCGSDVYQVLEDLKLMESTPDLDLLRELFELSAYALSYDGSQLFTQIVARLQPPDPNKYPGVSLLYKMAYKNATTSNLMPLGLCLRSPGATEVMPPDTTVYFDSIHRIKGSVTHMLTLAGDSGIVTVVSIYEQKPVRTLIGVTQPKDVKMVDDHHALILCNRELKLYDLDGCTFEMKLKGVMNQKMPFYDLHDPQHVVSLSRNRMYVNMTNLTTGDCVATFKVGEDRFLNSLLVSANGKMCVCGDETQKPFPLLVWDMTSRKLVYDLRIPHHEFITRLATITHDGHYVASVCKEVADSSPNFIIVYDLQSGTLFKKWKPEVNTCSIAISSEGSCVISGLEDTTLLVWDLVTGACRFSLKGHCAPVDVVRIDDSGSVCVTFDSTGKDRSVRAWNTTSGQLTAVFTPDEPVICCELSSDGLAVVLGLRGRQDVLTLLLCTGQSVDEAKPKTIPCFGSEENTGKVADMSEAG